MRRPTRRILARARDWMAPPRDDPPEKRSRPGQAIEAATMKTSMIPDDDVHLDGAVRAAPPG
jgi:hypothetical protein